jgi:tetratricopeptide (TPR) repeat protein
MMNRINYILFLLCTGVVLRASPDSADVEAGKAFQLYSAGKYGEALQHYLDLRHKYGPSSDLYFNAGVCELALNKIPEAKLDFEKALILKPGSSSIKNHLTSINQTIEPKIEELPPFLLLKWLRIIRDLLNQFTWGGLTLILSLISGGTGIAKYILKNPISFPVWTSMLACLLVSALFYFSRAQYEQTPRGILMESNSLKVAPSSNAQELLPLGGGTKLEIKDSLQDWYKIKLENNDQGWVRKSTIHKI